MIFPAMTMNLHGLFKDFRSSHIWHGRASIPHCILIISPWYFQECDFSTKIFRASLLHAKAPRHFPGWQCWQEQQKHLASCTLKWRSLATKMTAKHTWQLSFGVKSRYQAEIMITMTACFLITFKTILEYILGVFVPLKSHGFSWVFPVKQLAGKGC